MFTAYPGFEELPIRVEVQWQGRTRPVVARLAQWPTASLETAVLVCSFRDDAESGEWIITDKYGIYNVLEPQKRLKRDGKFQLSHPFLRHSTKWEEASEKKFRLLVQGIFNGGVARHQLARIFYLPELRNQLKVVVEMPDQEHLCWCPTQNLNDSSPFTLTDRSARLSSQNTEAYAQLRSAWQDTSSDARFAWEWSGLNLSEQIHKMTSLLNGSDERLVIEEEMRRIMRLILINYGMWGPDEQWSLSFTLGGSSHISHEDGRLEKNDQHLHQWNALLRESLMPQLRRDWLTSHPCVQGDWNIYAPSASVEIDQPPTAHEQLEARLALRDWLADKATPEHARELLESLDS